MPSENEQPKPMTEAQRRRDTAKILRAMIEEEKDLERFLIEHGYAAPRKPRE